MSVSQTEFRAAMLQSDAQVPLGLIDQTGGVAGRRFDVYRNNVAVSLTEALETGFPVIRKLLGNDNFKAISGVYLRQSPPQSPLMMHYGQDFPAFLRDFPPLKHLGYLGDVAEIETALRRSYHAADAVPVLAETLARIDPEKLAHARLHLAPSVGLLRSAWPIFDIWAYNSRPNQPKPRATAQDVLILRPDFDPEPHLLPPGGAAFITALQHALALGDAADTAADDAENFDLGTCLALLLSHGAIAKIELEDSQ